MALAVAGTLVDALGRLDREPGLRPIAGGVAVLLARALGSATAATGWIGIARLPELREVTVASGHVVLGAALTLDEVAHAPRVPSLLAAAIAATADPGIRSMGTLGGNVVAGGAASDPVAALVALGAEAEVMTSRDVRSVPVEDLVRDGVPPGSLVRVFRVPLVDTWGWQRVTMRGAMDRSVGSVAVAIGRGGCRIAVTWAADRVLRLPDTDTIFGAAAVSEAAVDIPAIRATAVMELGRMDLLDDDRASRAYREQVLPVLVARAVADALRRRDRGDA